jgi:hypothetical protein
MLLVVLYTAHFPTARGAYCLVCCAAGRRWRHVPHEECSQPTGCRRSSSECCSGWAGHKFSRLACGAGFLVAKGAVIMDNLLQPLQTVYASHTLIFVK